MNNIMNTYRITFSGRTKGAIGCFRMYTETIQADSGESALLKLYDKYDSVHKPEVTKKEG